MKLYSYIVKKDYGLAPNPYWGRLTLTVCKQDIRKSAKKGDWIIGTGSKNVDRPNKAYVDYSHKLVYAMKVSEVMTLKEYDTYCRQEQTEIKNKIPKARSDWKIKIGDCIYKYPIHGDSPILRPGLHCNDDIETDLKGENSLISDEFYYFGQNAINILPEFDSLVKEGQGYLICDNENLINKFINWLKGLGYEKNILHGEPQLRDLVTNLFDQWANSTSLK